jgi:serpin B
MTTATAQSANFFASALYAKLKAEPGNLFFSPFSVSVALGMAAAGARGETEKALAGVLGVPQALTERNRHYASLLQEANGGEDRPFELTTANALWGQAGYRFDPAFQEAIQAYYGGVFREVDFRDRPDEAVQAVNDWTSAQTRGKIPRLITLDVINADTRLVLTNAVYFKGKWAEEFDKARTQEEDFYGFAARSRAAMMHREGGCPYYEDDSLQAIDLPYQGGELSLLVVLPRDRSRAGLAAVEAGLDYDKLAAGLAFEEAVLLSLPRFKLETEFKLGSVLTALGAGVAFSSRADFSGITAEDRLRISEVVHKAFVEVNEEGTEAAAATAVVMLCEVARPAATPKVFQADHPFLFFIRSRRTGMILFAGRVTDLK